MAENWSIGIGHDRHSGSSQSSQEATVAAQSVRETEQRPSLLETLQTCLATTSPSVSDPSGNVSALRHQSRSIRSTSRGAVMKRRSRASRRVPTTVVEATSSDFKETVHRLTGIAPPTPTPVRPQPKRAGPVNFVRPVPQVPQPVPIPPSPAPPAFWPHFDQSIESEPPAPFRTTASSSTMSWWDAGFQESSHSMMSPSTTTTTTGPYNVSTSSGAYIDPDLSIDDWFQHGSDNTH